MQQVPQTPVQYEEQPVYYEEQIPVQPVQYVEQPVQYVEYTEPIEQMPEEYYDDIEPTETDIGDGADLDEGTVTAQYTQQTREPAPVIFQEKMAQKEQNKPKVVKSSFPVRKTQKDISPRITAMPTRSNTMAVKASTRPSPYDQMEEQDLTHDDWKNIQKKIDKQYEKKLKEVGDDALKKLKMF